MRACLGWAFVQALVCAVGVSGFSLSDLISDLVPLKITTGSTAQEFEGWGTSLAWFAEYIGCLEGAYSPSNYLAVSLLRQEVYMENENTCTEHKLTTSWQCSTGDALCSVVLMNLACLADSQQEKVADLLFDAESGLGLQIVRYNIGGSNTTLNATNSMRPFAAVPSMLLANGTYNWTLVSQPALVDHIITADIDVLNATSPGQ